MSSERIAMVHSWRVTPVVWLAMIVMLVSAAGAMFLSPHHVVADDKPEIKLEQILPSQFGEWVLDPASAPMLVDPTVQQRLDALYTQTMNRTYVNKHGDTVMLSIAYGRNQNSESTAAHRPEFCYTAQGFIVKKLGIDTLNLDKHQIQVMHLEARLGDRVEPIIYWVTLDEEASLPGLRRKLQQLKYGLQGLIVDGMLVRVSTYRHISNTTSLESDFALQERFLREMEQAVSPSFRRRFFGS